MKTDVYVSKCFGTKPIRFLLLSSGSVYVAVCSGTKVSKRQGFFLFISYFVYPFHFMSFFSFLQFSPRAVRCPFQAGGPFPNLVPRPRSHQDDGADSSPAIHSNLARTAPVSRRSLGAPLSPTLFLLKVCFPLFGQTL